MPGRPEEELSELMSSLRRMYSHVARITGKVLEAIRDWKPVEIEDDVGLAEMLKDTIENQATLFLARYQPLGIELLKAKAVIRVSYDLYRIARYEREIIKIIKLTEGKVEPSQRLVETAEKAFTMLDLAFNAFYEGDQEAFQKVKDLDNEIDEAYTAVLRAVAGKESLERREVVEALVLRHLERIADHSVYIAGQAL